MSGLLRKCKTVLLSVKICFLYKQKLFEASVARWSRGMIRASGARGPGFNSRTSPQLVLHLNKTAVETPGIEPGASRMRSERSTTELHPLLWYQSWTPIL